jgi:hypothetical protein
MVFELFVFLLAFDAHFPFRTPATLSPPVVSPDECRNDFSCPERLCYSCSKTTHHALFSSPALLHMKVVPFMALPRFVCDALILRYAIAVLCGGVTLVGAFKYNVQTFIGYRFRGSTLETSVGSSTTISAQRYCTHKIMSGWPIMVTTFFGVTGFESACGGRFRCLTMTLRWSWKKPSYSSKRKSASVSAEPLTISVRAVSRTRCSPPRQLSTRVGSVYSSTNIINATRIEIIQVCPFSRALFYRYGWSRPSCPECDVMCRACLRPDRTRLRPMVVHPRLL